ncbi:MAG: SCO family protein [Rhodobacteraceae bacterium]|nr:SCO family protein [Paracoccaceae bacterium]
MTKIFAFLALAILVLGLGGTYLYTQFAGDQYAQCNGGAVAGGDIGGPFELVDGTGATVTNEDVITKPSLIYFGYTFCPDVCPFDVARNAIAIDILDERGIDVTPVFISIDPVRDTPEVVASFAENMHPKMVGLTGSAEQVDGASKAYKTYYRKQEGDPDYYLVDHSTFSYLMSETGEFLDFFRRDVTPEAMAERIACFTS